MVIFLFAERYLNPHCGKRDVVMRGGWSLPVTISTTELYDAWTDSWQLVAAMPEPRRAFAATLSTNFVAPWARGHGLARELVDAVEVIARTEHFAVLNLDVRETQTAAPQLYESCGFECWGVAPYYARVDDRMIAGHYYSKQLT